jgi:phosphoenolpyruvate carboxykinase (ATP)
VTEPEPTFSTCFGAPFMPRRPEVYGNLLRDLIAKHGAIAGWSTPAGPAAPMAGSACRSRRRGLLTAAL